jgi:hypothetical protein
MMKVMGWAGQSAGLTVDCALAARGSTAANPADSMRRMFLSPRQRVFGLGLDSGVKLVVSIMQISWSVLKF